MTNFTIVGIPINSSGYANGVERMPEALRSAGLVERLNIRDAGDIHVAINDTKRDPKTGIIGFESIRRASVRIRSGIGFMLLRGERPLVIGGDCTLLIGVCAALRGHIGRVGLAFVDGHLDFYDGPSSSKGEAADMELAIVTGFGPSGLVDLTGPPPLIAPSDIVVLGYRDGDAAARDGAPEPSITAPGISLYDVRTLKQFDLAILGAKVEAKLATQPGAFWLHLDLDVLDEKVLPAVDYRMPGGLDWHEVTALVQPLAKSSALIGADITILNPNLDPDGRYAKRVVTLLGDLFGD